MTNCNKVRAQFPGLLYGDLSPAEAADQFFAFAAEHAAANHFDPAKINALMVQLLTH